MYFIDDIDLVFSLIGFESRFFDEISDILDSCIACSIDLNNIEHGSIIESLTVDTLVTGISISQIETIHSLREDTCARRLPGSTRSMKEIRMRNTSTDQTIF